VPPAADKRTPRPWRCNDGATVFSDHLHQGVASTAPDPFCREHYVSGPGGHYFAPSDDPRERAANAAFIVLACNLHEELVEALNECALRFEACAIAGGSDSLYAAMAVEKYRALIAKAQR
jgi:hypothetical protein